MPPAPSKPTAEQQIEFDLLFDALPDITYRDQRDAMERPLVSLAKQRQVEPIEFRFDDDLFVRVLPHQEYGQATIWDYDIILFLLGQLNGRADRGELTAKPGISVSPQMLLQAIGRGTGGKDYKELRDAIARLQTTMIETNIWMGKKLKRFKRFSFIQDFTEDDPGKSSSGGMTFGLPDWMVESVRSRKGILAIHPSYFLLSGGIERFLYRLARKYAGKQADGARMTMATVHDKSGSRMRKSDFAIYVRRVVEANDLPEYELALYRNDGGEEVLHMTPRTLSKLPPRPAVLASNPPMKRRARRE